MTEGTDSSAENYWRGYFAIIFNGLKRHLIDQNSNIIEIGGSVSKDQKEFL